MVNYGRELRMEADIRKKGKVEKAMEFVERIKKVQEEMKWQVDRGRKEVEEWKKEDKRYKLKTLELVKRKNLV